MKALGTMCAACGAEGLRWKEVKKYRYAESGLDDVWLIGGVRQATCGACREVLTHIEAEWQLLQVIAIILLRKQGLLTGPETRFLRKAANLSQDALAVLLGLRGQPTVSERERRDGPVMSYAEDLGFRMLILREFVAHLKHPEKNHLVDEHRAILEHLVQWLYLKTLELKASRATKKTIEFRRSNSEWTADTLKEAA